MKTLAIVNPKAAAGVKRIGWPETRAAIEKAIGPLSVAFTEYAGHGTELAADALNRGYERIIAVAGDGGLNEIVNGFFFPDGGPRNAEALLGFIMRGTGNDFQRTYGYNESDDLNKEVCRLLRGRTRRIDIGRLEYTGFDGDNKIRFFDNLASFGMSGAVDRAVAEPSVARRFGGTAAFLWATTRVLMRFQNQTVCIRINDGEQLHYKIRLLVVANGQFAGGKMWFAPHAIPDDGLFDIVRFDAMNRRQIVRNFLHIYKGTHLQTEQVHCERASSLQASSSEEVLLDVDGEALGRLPARFSLLPGALRILV